MTNSLAELMTILLLLGPARGGLHARRRLLTGPAGVGPGRTHGRDGR